MGADADFNICSFQKKIINVILIEFYESKKIISVI